MPKPLNTISIQGFKSIQLIKDLKLENLNVLVGANGAGKSNFVDFFRMLRAMTEGGLTSFVTKKGGADGFFYNGLKETTYITAHLKFGENEYRFILEPTTSNNLMVKGESVLWTGGGTWTTYGGGILEAHIKDWKGKRSRRGNYPGPESYVYDSVSSWIVYHFHDTSYTASMRRHHSVRDRRELNHDASNIAAFLFFIKNYYPERYKRIIETIQFIAPFFDDFLLEPEQIGEDEVIRLEWRQKGSSYPFQPSHFSDGTIRFICLTTALLQPTPPSTILIDEPELGLHPFALDVLAGMFKDASERTQIIVSTQSATLLNHFEANQVIVVDRQAGASRFRRLDQDLLAEWLKEFALGELWQKNIFDGGPSNE